MKKNLLPLLITAFILHSCEKKATCLNSMELTATSLTPTTGDNIVIRAPQGPENAVYQWNGPGVNLINQVSTLTLDNIKLSQSGVYYCSVGGNSDCSTVGDSIRIQVQLKQETPPCTLTNNYMRCSNIPDVNFVSVTQGFDGTYNAVSLYGYGGFGYPGVTVLFNSYNGNTEPLDGTHITAEGPSFNFLQQPNEVSISFIYASNYYHSRPGHKVYVSHVGGKLQVSFCDVVFYASTVPLTTCSAKLTEL